MLPGPLGICITWGWAGEDSRGLRMIREVDGRIWKQSPCRQEPAPPTEYPGQVQAVPGWQGWQAEMIDWLTE